MGRHTHRAAQQQAYLKMLGKPTDPEQLFKESYLALRVKLGMFNLTLDPFPDPETGKTSADMLGAGHEELMESLMNLANLALRYLGGGLYILGERTFSSVRRMSEKKFLNYKDVMTTWKNRVWKNTRDLDGRKFDAYTLSVVPHAEMVKRIQAVESIHKLLNNVSGIYNAAVSKSSDDWMTPDCEKAINNLEKIGFHAKHLDMLNTVSKQYANSRKKQSLYLHGYTPKRILDLMSRCEKLAEYGDEKYIKQFEDTYLKFTDQCETFEEETVSKQTELSEKDELTAKEKKELDERQHESKIRAARLYWLAHFLKAAYVITGDILSDIEALSVAVERCISKEEN